MNHCVVDAARAGDEEAPREGRRGRRGHRPAGAVMSHRSTVPARHRHDLRATASPRSSEEIGRARRASSRSSVDLDDRTGHRHQRRAARPARPSRPPSRRPATRWHERRRRGSWASWPAAPRCSRWRSGSAGGSDRWPRIPSRRATAGCADGHGRHVRARRGRPRVVGARLHAQPGRGPARPGAGSELAFTVIGPDGRPVTAYDEQHERDLHLIVVRRDLTGFQHVHPTPRRDHRPMDHPASTSLPGAWRRARRLLALGRRAAGAGRGPAGARRLHAGAAGADQLTAHVDGYDVTLDGAVGPARRPC